MWLLRAARRSATTLLLRCREYSRAVAGRNLWRAWPCRPKKMRYAEVIQWASMQPGARRHIVRRAAHSGPDTPNRGFVIRDRRATTLPDNWRSRRSAMTREYRIASIPADGIGPEVISAGLEVLDAVA